MASGGGMAVRPVNDRPFDEFAQFGKHLISHEIRVVGCSRRVHQERLDDGRDDESGAEMPRPCDRTPKRHLGMFRKVDRTYDGGTLLHDYILTRLWGHALALPA